METTLRLDLKLDGSDYIISLDLETIKPFQALMLALQRDEIREFEVCSTHTAQGNPIRIIIKKPVKNSPHSLFIQRAVLNEGVLTYMIDDDTLAIWLEHIYEPYILWNGKGTIYEDTWWNINIAVPVKSDPRGKTFKRKDATIRFDLKSYLQPPTTPQKPKRR